MSRRFCALSPGRGVVMLLKVHSPKTVSFLRSRTRILDLRHRQDPLHDDAQSHTHVTVNDFTPELITREALQQVFSITNSLGS